MELNSKKIITLSSQHNFVTCFQELKILLKKYNVDNYEQEVCWILEYILQKTSSQLYKDCTQRLSKSQLIALQQIITQRISGKPLAYIFKTIHFWQYDFFITPPVFIPRKESEILLEVILEVIEANSLKLLLEVGCGSGVLSLCLALTKPLRITALDLATSAIFVSKQNKKKYLSQLKQQGSKVKFLQKDANQYLTHNSKKKFDMLFSNPPYIAEQEKNEVSWEALKFEDKNALFATKNGLFFYYLFANLATKVLIPQGFVVLEHGYKQKDKIIKIFTDTGWRLYLAKKDFSQKDRVLVFQAPLCVCSANK